MIGVVEVSREKLVGCPCELHRNKRRDDATYPISDFPAFNAERLEYFPRLLRFADFDAFLGEILKWRRERDSNPRYPFRYSGFQDRLFQPLTHLSARWAVVIITGAATCFAAAKPRRVSVWLPA